MRKLLSAAILLLPLAGCTAVQQQRVDYAACPTGHMCFYDVKTGAYWWQRVLTPAHRAMAFRDEAGRLHAPVDEQPNSGDMLEELAGPLGTAASHVVVPVGP